MSGLGVMVLCVVGRFRFGYRSRLALGIFAVEYVQWLDVSQVACLPEDRSHHIFDFFMCVHSVVVIKFCACGAVAVPVD